MIASALLAAAVTAAGCGGDDEIIGAVPGIDTGTLLQSWTIEGTRDVNKCVQYGADRMRVVVYDEDGSVNATELAPCADFQIRLRLRTDRYTGAATFIDVDGDPVSRTQTLVPFTVSEDATTTVNLDFAAEAMRP